MTLPSKKREAIIKKTSKKGNKNICLLCTLDITQRYWSAAGALNDHNRHGLPMMERGKERERKLATVSIFSMLVRSLLSSVGRWRFRSNRMFNRYTDCERGVISLGNGWKCPCARLDSTPPFVRFIQTVGPWKIVTAPTGFDGAYDDH